ncbi:MAG: haloacid dehalogenase-like hydrolase [Alphaproteobacteria bacterium]|nr:haloacid dehalogenase-like hydrolase [Alphaproteobacteria bacterium]
MRVGIDFDNTIVRYDGLFHKVAREVAGLPDDVPVSKVAVRDHLRRIGQEDVWTEMQGLVYGARMAEAEAYDGVLDTLAWAREAGLTLFVISHKTRHPFRGPAYDLHAAARGWVERVLGPSIPAFFEPTKDEKLARIAACGCDLFIDDLPEILRAPGFPAATRPILFDPEANHSDPALTTMADWPAIRRLLEDEWTRRR